MTYEAWKVRDALFNLLGEHVEWTLKDNEVKDEADFYSKFWYKTGVDELERTVSTNDKDVHKVLWANVLVKINEVELNQYKEDRRIGTATTVGYPDFGSQLDLLYHDMADGKLGVGATTGSWYVGITSVKTSFPKP